MSDKRPAESNTAAQPEKRLNIVLFSGGRGTHTISEMLLRHPQISITVLINAYDDGLSTGAIRRFIPGMLGPSDVRKNLTRMMRTSDDCDRALRAISDYRLPVGTTAEQGLRFFEDLRDKRCPANAFVSEHYPSLSVSQSESLASYCQAFLEHYQQAVAKGIEFSFSDCAVGNVIFGGAFLVCGRDFNRTVAELETFHKMRGRLLNVTQGENYFLVAKKQDGKFLYSEAEIVSEQDASPIERLYLLDEELYRRNVEFAQALDLATLEQRIYEAGRVPQINPEADAALRTADIIIFGPGTQHSSLFPSYMTAGVAEAIAANKTADKLFLANIWRDLDIQNEDAASLMKKFYQCMSRYGQLQCDWQDLVTHFFFQEPPADSVNANQYLNFDPKSFGYPMDRVRLANWESGSGKHAGGRVFEELQAIVQSRIDLTRMHYTVSIIVPVLNEVKTIGEVLLHLQSLDFQKLDLGKEILVVDGGSCDGTQDVVKDYRGIKLIQLPNHSGKGEAVRAGIRAALGNVLVTFPGDGEYDPDDLYPIVEAMVKNGYPVVFGSRAVKCINLNERLREVYGTAGIPFLVSKYGGILISVTTLFLYNRYISDLLTSVKGFDAKALRGLALECKSFDLEAELTAKFSIKENYILELPVEYRPRTRNEGKKIRTSDGLRCILALFRYKFFKWSEK